ncbi:hypothetical protein GZ998_05460 [Actinomyces sp. 594]|uniref:hypothetical protein n=1 Tax=Actinomyces sp. 594 TaxID=2057793 RepID=UPI001C5A2CBF|nr:hypothetical protein [Actinomyces sp. 594]MBW3068960.1 hypothetical protein [Actinomyces sp. 594]
MRHTIALDPQAGTGLFIPALWGTASILDAGERHERLREAMGLGPSGVTAPLWANLAVPLLTPRSARLAPANDQVAGHPFLWLSERLLTRYELVADDGTTSQEGLDTWVCRLLLEALAAGWYDRQSGLWIDVLADAGATPARVRDWIAGAADPVLDGLEAPTGADADWAIGAAQELVPALRAASDALGAVELTAALGTDDPDVVQAAATAAQCLQVVDGHSQAPALWAQLAADPTRGDLLRQGRDHLARLADDGQDALAWLADVLTSTDGLEGAA